MEELEKVLKRYWSWVEKALFAFAFVASVTVVSDHWTAAEQAYLFDQTGSALTFIARVHLSSLGQSSRQSLDTLTTIPHLPRLCPAHLPLRLKHPPIRQAQGMRSTPLQMPFRPPLRPPPGSSSVSWTKAPSSGTRRAHLGPAMTNTMIHGPTAGHLTCAGLPLLSSSVFWLPSGYPGSSSRSE